MALTIISPADAPELRLHYHKADGTYYYPHQFEGRIARDQYQEMQAWAREQFGIHDWHTQIHQDYGTSVVAVFVFRDGNAAFAFRMRWC